MRDVRDQGEVSVDPGADASIVPAWTPCRPRYTAERRILQMNPESPGSRPNLSRKSRAPRLPWHPRFAWLVIGTRSLISISHSAKFWSGSKRRSVYLALQSTNPSRGAIELLIGGIEFHIGARKGHGRLQTRLDPALFGGLAPRVRGGALVREASEH